MGNKARSQRSRPHHAGPLARATDVESIEATRLEKAEHNHLYQQRHRERSALRLEEAVIFMKETSPDEIDAISTRDVSRVAQRIVRCICDELNLLPGPLSRQTILEKVLRHNQVWPFLLYYYPQHIEAKSIHYLIQSLKAELQSLAIPFSNNMLSRKGALLDAAVSGTVGGVRVLARVLGTKPEDIQAALERRDDFKEGVPRFTPLRRQKRRDGSTQYTTEVVQAWWHSRTRVSPNMKDIVNKGGGLKKGGETHPKHYLTITQVCFQYTTQNLYFTACIFHDF